MMSPCVKNTLQNPYMKLFTFTDLQLPDSVKSGQRQYSFMANESIKNKIDPIDPLWLNVNSTTLLNAYIHVQKKMPSIQKVETFCDL